MKELLLAIFILLLMDSNGSRLWKELEDTTKWQHKWWQQVNEGGLVCLLIYLVIKGLS